MVVVENSILCSRCLLFLGKNLLSNARLAIYDETNIKTIINNKTMDGSIRLKRNRQPFGEFELKLKQSSTDETFLRLERKFDVNNVSHSYLCHIVDDVLVVQERVLVLRPH